VTTMQPGAAGQPPAALLALPAALEQAAVALDLLAQASGDERFARAAGVVRGRHGGRPRINDSAALAQMAALLRDRAAQSVDAAAAYVARSMPGQHSPESTAQRLARKYRRYMQKVQRQN
jgi:hypothetical protein